MHTASATVIAVLVVVAAAAAAPMQEYIEDDADAALGDVDADQLIKEFEELLQQEDRPEHRDGVFEAVDKYGVSCDEENCNKACSALLGFTGGYCNHYKLCTCVNLPAANALRAAPAAWERFLARG